MFKHLPLRALKYSFPSLVLASLITRVATAQEATRGPTRVDQLGAFMHVSAQEARDARRAIVLTGLATGAALVPAGETLWRRADPVSRSIGAGMTIGGAAPLAFSLLSLLPTPMERLDQSFTDRRDSGVSPSALMRMTESDWRAASATAHHRRILSGAIELGVGGAAVGAGLGLLLARSVGGLSANGQHTLGSLFIGPGVPIFALGIRSLLQETVVESAWTKYRTTGLAQPEASAGLAAGASVALLPHGALVSATLAL